MAVLQRVYCSLMMRVSAEKSTNNYPGASAVQTFRRQVAIVFDANTALDLNLLHTRNTSLIMEHALNKSVLCHVLEARVRAQQRLLAILLPE